MTRVAGAFEPSEQGAALPRAIVADLSRLDALGSGLGSLACAYVRSGERSEVPFLVRQAAEAHPNTRWADPHAPTKERRRLLAAGEIADLEMLRRYMEVLEFEHRFGHAPGSDAVPATVRTYAAELFVGFSELSDLPRPPGGSGWVEEAVAPEQLLATIKALGGRLADLFDILLGDLGHGYRHAATYRAQASVEALMRRHPPVLAASVARLSGDVRAGALLWLASKDVLRDPAFASVLVAAAAGKPASREVEAAVDSLAALDPAVLRDLVTPVLASSGADARSALVQAAIRNGSDLLKDVLRDHLPREKTARIRAAIEAVVEQDRTPTPEAELATSEPEANGYRGADGSWIAVPPMAALTPPHPHPLTPEQLCFFESLIAKCRTGDRARGASSLQPVTDKERTALLAILTMSEPVRDGLVYRLIPALSDQEDSRAWLCGTLDRLPGTLPLRVVAQFLWHATSILGGYWSKSFAAERLGAHLRGPDGDLRILEALDIDLGRNVNFMYGQDVTLPMAQGDLLRQFLLAARHRSSYHRDWDNPLLEYPAHAVWPYLADNLAVFDEALGLAPATRVPLSRDKALECLALLPTLPERYYRFAVEIALTAREPERGSARKLLKGAAGLDDKLITALDDARSEVRADAATWLADMRAAGACPALFKRLKAEKSDAVRTALIQALRRLGADLSGVIGPETLIAEAEAGMKAGKAKLPAWLSPEMLPSVRFRGGETAPRALVTWWAASATKAKDPAATGRFGLYLDQLEPADAQAVSAALLEAWIAHDTHQATLDEANAYAAANVAARFQQNSRWARSATEEQAFAELKREKLAEMPNSASDAKGLLALACRAEPVWAAQRVRWYLKNHGRRSHQAAALLDMLAGNGSPAALQVVIAASVRLKQKSNQKHAGELVARFAEDRGWTVDELADRTIPAAGLDDDGALALPCGEDAKPYVARMSAALTLAVHSPQGKPVASLPAGEDKNSKESKKALSTAKKELKQIVEMQTDRLYEAMCAGRGWPVADWTASFHEHPVMRRMVERLVWEGLGAEGESRGLFRPTPEGDFTNTADEAVDIASFERIRIAHGALVGEADDASWLTHLRDYDVTPLMPQFGRARLDEADRDNTEIDDRKGWMSDSTIIRGLATKRRYERVIGDGGGCSEYEKLFPGAGIAAVIEHTGANAVEETIPAAVKILRFRKTGRGARYGESMKLGDVPPALLAECRADYEAIAARGAFDPEWEKKSPW